MNKAEIMKALAFIKDQKKTFTDWIVNHPINPYVSKVASDVRHFESEEYELLRLYALEYPTLEDIKALTGKELMLVYRALDKPNTPEQQEVYRYVSERVKQYATT